MGMCLTGTWLLAAWWSEAVGIYVGAFGGAGVGVVCGTYGAVAGVLAQKGQARRAVLGFHVGMLVAAVLTLLGSIIAVIAGQPYHVFYPLLLLGGIPSFVLGGLLRPMRQRYVAAEQRRLEAEEIRREVSA